MNDIRDLLETLSDAEPRVSAADVLEHAQSDARRHRRRRTRRRAVSAAAVAALITGVVVFVTAGHDHDHAQVAIHPAPDPVVRVQRYSVDATVLEDAGHGPQFCTEVAQSLPPQCSGTPVAGWDWKQIADKETRGSTTWGDYHLVGTYDGHTFTITQPPGPIEAHTAPSVPIKTPCPAPAGGWVVTDRSHFGLDDFNAFTSTARGQPDFAGLWTDNSTPVGGRVSLFPEQVLTVAFTGNLDLHRAQLRALWGGPICVVQHAYSWARLTQIQQELNGATARALGLQVDSSAIDEVGDVLNVQVVVATPSLQAKVDRRYGRGVVVLSAVLTPVR